MEKDLKQLNMIERARVISQWLSFIIPNAYMGFLKTKKIYQGSLKSVCVPFLNCHSCPTSFFTCPIGAIQHFVTIHKIPFTVIGYLLAISMTVGAMACGWLCPFGLLQDLMYKIKSFKITIPNQLTSFRYFVLLFLIFLIPFFTQETWFSKLCPMGTLQAGLPWIIWNPMMPVDNIPAVSASAIGTMFLIKLVILLSFLCLFVIAKRPFCRVICPLGAIMGFFNRFSLVRLQVDTGHCKDCNKCVGDCLVELNVSHDPNHSACVRCLKCLKCENVSMRVGPEKNQTRVLPQPETDET
ncbi:MAG: 4Fe-4S binding protein [Fibrobacteria bacterium]|nr:4Fe-4S binding protein [Fibrobacteria bacterium]